LELATDAGHDAGRASYCTATQGTRTALGRVAAASTAIVNYEASTALKTSVLPNGRPTELPSTALFDPTRR